MYTIFERYLTQQFRGYEGERGVQSLEKLAEALGYGTGYMRGRALEEFLGDNSGAIEALLEWIGNTVGDVPEWEESLSEELCEDFATLYKELCEEEEEEEEQS